MCKKRAETSTSPISTKLDARGTIARIEGVEERREWDIRFVLSTSAGPPAELVTDTRFLAKYF